MTRMWMLTKGWIVSGVVAAFCNYVYTLRLNDPARVVRPHEAAPGLLIFLGIIVLAQLIYQAMKKAAPRVRFPAVLYITFIGILVTWPGLLPCADFVNKSVGKIYLLPLCTPILAYSGVAAGKDLKTFREQGVAIVLTTLIALVGTFVGSAVIAQLVMKWTGVF
ncbi:DUF340 domain-containing protein [Pyramidobacter porci]